MVGIIIDGPNCIIDGSKSASEAGPAERPGFRRAVQVRQYNEYKYLTSFNPGKLEPKPLHAVQG